MGYYLQAPGNFEKAEFLCSHYGGEQISEGEAARLVKEEPDNVAVVCVVSNMQFEAAAYCYSQQEFEEFSDPRDARPKVWLRFDGVKRIREACGFVRR